MKRTIIILAKAGAGNTEDMAFYNLMLRQDPGLLSSIAIIILLPSVEQFIGYLNTLSSTSTFSLLIHMGNKSMNPPQDGIDLYEDLGKLPFFGKLKIEYTSRQGESTHNGARVLHSQKLMKNGYDIESIPINRVSDLLNISNNNQPGIKVDFAVLTALYDDEHTAFDLNMRSKEIGGQKNVKVGNFLESKELEDDYKGDILLAWQQDMGIVDAAAFSSRIIAKHSPKFLIMGGVCGGRKDDVNIYDVIIPKNIHDYMSGKYKKGVFIPRPLRAEPNQELVGFLETRKREIISRMKKIAQPNLLSILDNGFKIHFKNYACGPWVVKTNGTLLEIAENADDDIIGLEMESLGVIRAGKLFAKNDEYGLIVKSVMDFTDENKTDGDKGLIKTNAALISYLCVRAILPLLLEFKDPKAIN
jgi:nucleoside phosphorylase